MDFRERSDMLRLQRQMREISFLIIATWMKHELSWFHENTRGSAFRRSLIARPICLILEERRMVGI